MNGAKGAAWSQTVRSLAQQGAPMPAISTQYNHRALRLEAPQVSAIERLAPKKILASWCGPTLGRQGEHIWHLKRARHPGTCLLSGRTVNIGDYVYQSSINRNDVLAKVLMILDDAVNDVV